MDTADFVRVSTNILMGSGSLSSDHFGAGLVQFDSTERLKVLEMRVKIILEKIFKFSDFCSKYDISSKDATCPTIYVHTGPASKHTYLMEAYPIVTKFETACSTRQIEELEYHPLFESVIFKYTKSNQKPNPILRDTRAAEFCYRLSIKVEAVPLISVNRDNRLTLLREFLILHHLWERYRHDLQATYCGSDQMIGFPMPFEFANVVGSEYDFTADMQAGMMFYDVNGKYESIAKATIPSVLPNAAVGVASSLSYMSYEKLGPSLDYLVEIMRTQGKTFSVSSALKVYDQLLCRLMVMHKYGVVHCDPNPSCLFFGPSETCNVLYISEFSTALLKPETGAQFPPIPQFHDRFVSYMRFRDRKCHYVHDIESAFYVFIYMLLGKMPWDMRMASSVAGTGNGSETLHELLKDMPESPYTDKSVTVEDKEKFWQTPDMFSRVFRLTDLEFHEPLYQNFSVDLLESLYTETKKALVAVPHLNPTTYSKDVFVPGSQVYNIYFGLRRTIATYFRFESLSIALKDPQGASKIELLNKQRAKDKRIAWDVSHWCWNHLDPRPLARVRSSRSLVRWQS